MADKMTLEKFEEACEIVGKVTNKTGLMYSQCFSDRKQGISETGKYAEDRRFQNPRGLL